MNQSQVNTFILKRFESNWFETPVEYPNARIETDGLAEWIRVTILSNKNKQIGFKGGSHRGGTLDVQVFTRINTGPGRINELAEMVGALFADLVSGTLVFKPHTIFTVGESIAQGLNTVKSGWYQVNCSINFTYID